MKRLFVVTQNRLAEFHARTEDEGATIAEYALLVALIAVAAVAAITAFGGRLGSFFSGLPARLGF